MPQHYAVLGRPSVVKRISLGAFGDFAGVCEVRSSGSHQLGQRDDMHSDYQSAYLHFQRSAQQILKGGNNSDAPIDVG